MDPQLLYYTGAVATAGAVTSVARSFFLYRQAKNREESVTDRLGRALEGTVPGERPDIIRALGGTIDTPEPPAPSAPEPGQHSPLDWLRRLFRFRRADPPQKE